MGDLSIPIHNSKQQLLDAESMSAPIISGPVLVDDVNCWAVHLIWEDGTAVAGDLVVSGSVSGEVYTDLSVTTIASNSGSIMYDPGAAVGYSYFRVEWRPVTADSNLTVWYNTKII